MKADEGWDWSEGKGCTEGWLHTLMTFARIETCMLYMFPKGPILLIFFFLRGLKKNMKQIKYATMLRQENQKHNDRGIHALHV